MPGVNSRLIISTADELLSGRTRRDFFRLMAIGGTAVMLPSVFAACDSSNSTSPSGGVTLDLSTDVGILNYAYALEQLEAAFYTQAVASLSSSNLSSAEQTVITDIKYHEVIHREAFKALLGTAKIGDLQPNFSAIKFTQRTSSGYGVLEVAKTFEDLGVSAYNGAGKYLKDASYLLVAGKIVSVEARHASAIRDLLNPGSTDFAGDDVVSTSQGLDKATEPSDVLSSASAFISTTITIGTQPA